VLGQHCPGPLISGLDDAPHFLVNLLRHRLAVVALLTDLLAQENQFLFLPEGHRAQFLAHPVAGDHRPGDLGHLLQVVGRAGGDIVEGQLLRCPPAQGQGELAFHLPAGDDRAVLFR